MLLEQGIAQCHVRASSISAIIRFLLLVKIQMLLEPEERVEGTPTVVVCASKPLLVSSLLRFWIMWLLLRILLSNGTHRSLFDSSHLRMFYFCTTSAIEKQAKENLFFSPRF